MAKKERGDVADLTIGNLLTRLKPVQLWALLGAACAALGGAVAVGHRLGAAGADSRVQQVMAKAEGETAGLKKEVESLREGQAKSRGLEEKERFLALYVRYVLAKEAQAKSPDDEAARADLASTRRGLEEFLRAGVARGESVPDTAVDFRGLVIHKGGGARDASISFRYDGSVWPVPREFALVERD